MRIARALLVAHVAALAFGLGGLLIALPHPELWVKSELGRRVFDFGMRYGGSTHILFGALAMLAFGIAVLGARRTLIFFACAVGLSLSAELIGTGTGWPFGNYAYTDYLGYKVLGRVPFTIPLSWFYMGLASYLLGRTLATRLGVRRVAAWGLGLGVWFLIVWDLVLDPAMADSSMTVKFWHWHQAGPYYGMPVQNYAGWAATGLLFMALGRALWRRDVDPVRDGLPLWFPMAVYAANTGFAMVLSASVGLWPPIALSALLGLAPALLAWQPRPPRRAVQPQPSAVG